MSTTGRMLAKLQTKQSFRRVFDSPDGQRVLLQLCREAFVFNTTFVAGDPHLTTLNEGSRRLALSILKSSAVDSSKLLKMMETIEQQKGPE